MPAFVFYRLPAGDRNTCPFTCYCPAAFADIAANGDSNIVANPASSHSNP
ncbi:hypothetical protein [Anaerolinea sp.]|nr:hypothetical protein [Anaerolinea sp.]